MLDGRNEQGLGDQLLGARHDHVQQTFIPALQTGQDEIGLTSGRSGRAFLQGVLTGNTLAYSLGIEPVEQKFRYWATFSN